MRSQYEEAPSYYQNPNGDPNACGERVSAVDTWTLSEKRQQLKRLMSAVPTVDRNDVNIKCDLLLGEGTYGQVNLGYFRNRRGSLAIKNFKFTPKFDILHEAAIQILLQDTGLVPRCYGVMESTEGEFCMVMDNIRYGTTLEKFLQRRWILSNEWMRQLCLKLATGLWLIHKKRVLLNDLKEDNILVMVSATGIDIKFIDFGYSSFRSSIDFQLAQEQHSCYPHIAPEVRQGQCTSESSDVYSLWRLLMMINCVARRVPFNSMNEHWQHSTLQRSLPKTIAVLTRWRDTECLSRKLAKCFLN